MFPGGQLNFDELLNSIIQLKSISIKVKLENNKIIESSQILSDLSVCLTDSVLLSRLSRAQYYSSVLDASQDCLACSSMIQISATRLTSPRNYQKGQTVHSHKQNGYFCLNLHFSRLSFKNQDSLTLHSSGATKIARESILTQVTLNMHRLIF